MVSEADFVKTLGLTRVMATDSKTLNIEVSNTNRPGMQFANYWDFFPYERPQLLGKVEMTYLSQLDETTRRRFNEDLPSVEGLMETTVTDYASVAGMFEDAGVEYMSWLARDDESRMSWQALLAYTHDMGEGE